MPISVRRVIAVAASLVCRVDSMAVIADSIAILALAFRISTTIIVSGSPHHRAQAQGEGHAVLPVEA